MKSNKSYFSEEKLHYGLRKLSVGIVSVVLSTSAYALFSSQVKADTTSEQPVTSINKPDQSQKEPQQVLETSEKEDTNKVNTEKEDTSIVNTEKKPVETTLTETTASDETKSAEQEPIVDNNLSTLKGQLPDAKTAIQNFNDLTGATTAQWENIDPNKTGKQNGFLVINYADGTRKEVAASVNVYTGIVNFHYINGLTGEPIKNTIPEHAGQTDIQIGTSNDDPTTTPIDSFEPSVYDYVIRGYNHGKITKDSPDGEIVDNLDNFHFNNGIQDLYVQYLPLSPLEISGQDEQGNLLYQVTMSTSNALVATKNAPFYKAENEDYSTNPLYVPGYELVTTPANASGKVGQTWNSVTDPNPIKIVYVYKKLNQDSESGASTPLAPIIFTDKDSTIKGADAILPTRTNQYYDYTDAIDEHTDSVSKKYGYVVIGRVGSLKGYGFYQPNYLKFYGLNYKPVSVKFVDDTKDKTLASYSSTYSGDENYDTSSLVTYFEKQHPDYEKSTITGIPAGKYSLFPTEIVFHYNQTASQHIYWLDSESKDSSGPNGFKLVQEEDINKQVIGSTYKLTKATPDNYALANGQEDLTSVTIDGKDRYIMLVHQLDTKADTKTIHQTVIVQKPDKNSPDNNNLTGEFTRTITTDKVTGDQTTDEWKPTKVDSFIPEQIDGYKMTITKDGKTVDQIPEISSTSPDGEIYKVSYTQIKQPEKTTSQHIYWLDSESKDSSGPNGFKLVQEEDINKQVIGSTYKLTKATPDNYALANNQDSLISVTIDGKDRYIMLIHQLDKQTDTKTIHQTVIVQKPDKNSPDNNNLTGEFTRTITTDKVTGKQTTDEWKPTKVDSFIPEQIDGYKMTITKDGKTVDQIPEISSTSPDGEIYRISYTQIKQPEKTTNQHIYWLDSETKDPSGPNGFKLVQDEDINKQVIGSTYKLTKITPDNYALANGQEDLTSVTIDGKDRYIMLIHQLDKQTDTKAIHQTIIVQKPDKNSPDSNNLTGEFTRTITTDKVTGDQTTDEWKPTKVDSFIPEQIDGYKMTITKDGKTVEQIPKISSTSPDGEIYKVSYTQINSETEQPNDTTNSQNVPTNVPANEPEKTENNNPQTVADTTNSPSTNEESHNSKPNKTNKTNSDQKITNASKASEQTFAKSYKTPVINSTNKSNSASAKLPETGAKQTNILAILGLTALISAISLAFRPKRK
ncbi:LPXTG-motif cell wall-anchored protein [Lactobacillus colini]|uniref:LPXTG-motif cell wall-anchored protein n=1 Tax=Lactobacillus colini TaxID=1819254 RepID=A0ABS4MBN6_9LACO|nr:Rib/alpha-like domain-containing protein [Lactobacillus colini]MBP2057093.1 LPXTG-motif cell wall-anchored protein [Lactobacillus colini]